MTYLIYARVSPRGSSWAGGETSIPDQIAECRAYATARDPAAEFLVVEDQFESGGSAARPGYQRILADLDTGNPPWDVLIVRHLDRLTRSLVDALPLLARLRNAGRGLVAVLQNLDLSTPTGRAMMHMILTFAQWEREMGSERTMAKMVSICRAGGWPVGKPPFGYRRAAPRNNVLAPDPEKAAIVMDAYARYARGESPAEICRLHKLARNQLWNILRNPAYVGTIRYGGHDYPGAHPAIVPRDLWDAVQPKVPLPARARPNRDTAYVYLLAGLVRCPCGNGMTCYSSRGRGNKCYPYYQCTDSVNCKGRIAAAPLEAVVLEALACVAYNAADVEAVKAEILALQREESATANPELREIEIRLGELRRRADGLADAMASGRIAQANVETWNRRLAETTAEVERAEGERNAIAASVAESQHHYEMALAAADELVGLKQLLDSAADRHELRRLVAAHVSEVKPTKEGAEIILATGGRLDWESKVASPRGLTLTVRRGKARLAFRCGSGR